MVHTDDTVQYGSPGSDRLTKIGSPSARDGDRSDRGLVRRCSYVTGPGPGGDGTTVKVVRREQTRRNKVRRDRHPGSEGRGFRWVRGPVVGIGSGRGPEVDGNL